MVGFVLGCVGSLVIGAATVLTAVYLRRLVGYPFIDTATDDTLYNKLKAYSTTGRTITVCCKIPGGVWFISGR